MDGGFEPQWKMVQHGTTEEPGASSGSRKVKASPGVFPSVMALPSSRLLASLPQSGQGILEHQHVVKKEEVGVLPPKTTVVQHRGFPDQKREQEVDSAAAEDFQHLMQNLHLPDAHRLYSYGERQIVFSTVVAAPQENAGVVIVQDYVGFPQQPGHQIVHSDEAIQNDAWQRQGPFLPIRDGTFGLPSAADWRRVDWSQAVDMRGARQLAAQRGYPRCQSDFHRLHRLRNS
ncbi:unnamed protein product [Durusdinium trenchii]|uniref:Uncharacterized protein n=1 Tax=Durusdinium trenchii TaxID=1381693 RepID=A0ABP0PQX4_9DINO